MKIKEINSNSHKCQVLSFDIVNIHIIALGSPLEELIYHGFHSIYYTIKSHIYKHLGGIFFFWCGIDIFSFFIHLQTTPIMCIGSSNKVGYLTWEAKNTTPGYPILETWIKNNKVKGWFVDSMSLSLMQWFIHLPITKEIWEIVS
jgi:hypothetical protein